MSSEQEIQFLQWALPRLGYRWEGFRKPRQQVLKRIRERMQELALTGGYPAYREYLERNPEEWARLDRMCDVTISSFFRDRGVWDFMRDTLLPDLLTRNRNVPFRAWSAGCCNGEEAYSLAIIVRQLAANIEAISTTDALIIASDRNPAVMERARKGRYPRGALNELKQGEIDRFFLPVDTPEEDYQVRDPLKRMVRFERRDIAKSIPDTVFDLIMCRNLVFTYFSKERQHEFLNRLDPRLKAGGFLVVGSHEKLPETDGISLYNRTHPIYQKQKKS
ncbi:MAG: CheR family methyltransferase [Balneolaceae bacterium]|nr:CheR family methyltransferase [Balneolaceae bacterium]